MSTHNIALNAVRIGAALESIRVTYLCLASVAAIALDRFEDRNPGCYDDPQDRYSGLSWDDVCERIAAIIIDEPALVIDWDASISAMMAKVEETSS